MQVVAVLVAAACFSLSVEAQNVICGPKTTTKSVTVEDKKTYSFKTQKGKKYKGGTTCTVDYKMGDSCTKMSFVCNKFNTNNKDKKKCTKGDKVTVTVNGKPKVYCKTKKPKVFSTGDMTVVFESDKKKHGPGAVCKVKCTEAAATATTEGTGRVRSSTLCGDDLKHLYASLPANITFTVQCCNGGKSFLTECGARKPCETACGSSPVGVAPVVVGEKPCETACGSSPVGVAQVVADEKPCETACGSSPVGVAQVVAGEPAKGKDYCGNQQCYQCGGERECQELAIVIFIPCGGWVGNYCNQVIENGDNCPALYENIGIFSLDFCCYCNSVYDSCRCDCCECRNVGGTCNGQCEDYSCPP